MLHCENQGQSGATKCGRYTKESRERVDRDAKQVLMGEERTIERAFVIR
jgi:hypothetical protein